MIRRRKFLLGLAAMPIAACRDFEAPAEFFAGTQQDAPAQQLISSAREQIGVTTSYDPAYVSLTYPG